jgi:hypothetical protein
MNCPDYTPTGTLAFHPELGRVLLANPTWEYLSVMMEYHFFDKLDESLKDDIIRLLPNWEQQACDGNEMISTLIHYLTVHAPNILSENKIIKSNLLRIRLLAATPGILLFPLSDVQEHLFQYLQTADVLADLPQFEVISISSEEIKPLSSDLSRFCLTPHSRRYIQNLFHYERCEAILSVLAYLAKNYPLQRICRQAYALMLSLDDFDIWGRHPFCLRLLTNRFWEFQLTASNH